MNPVNPNPVNWAPPQEDKVSGLTTQYCTFTVGENTYKVTIEYNKKDNGGYKGDMDAAIKRVIEATWNVFPELEGTTISFNLNDYNDTIIKDHPLDEYKDKRLSEIYDETDGFCQAVEAIAKAFFNEFHGLKKQTEEKKGVTFRTDFYDPSVMEEVESCDANSVESGEEEEDDSVGNGTLKQKTVEKDKQEEDQVIEINPPVK
jgi:hypothetical protein